jgi:hypothetical protein
MPPFLPQAKPEFPDNADYSKKLFLLGDTLGQAVGDFRNQQRLTAIGEAAKGGNYAAARDAAFGAGRVDLGIKFQDSLDTKQNRAEDVAWRQQQADRQQSNADRNFGMEGAKFEFEKNYKNQELGLKRLALEFKNQGGFKDLKEKADVEAGLRKEFSGLSGNFRDVRDSYGRIETIAKEIATDKTGVGDVALIFNYMKMLDPQSVVREGEFDTARKTGGIPEKVWQWFETVKSGKLLPNEVRSEMVGKAKSLYQRQETQHNSLVKEFEGIGNRLGVDIRNVTPNYSPAGGGNPQDPLGIR